MKINMAIASVAAALSVTSSAWAGYGDLKNAFDTYTPPAAVMNLMRETPSVSETVPTAEKSTAASAVMGRMRTEWEGYEGASEAISDAAKATMKRLSHAAKNPDAAAEALQGTLSPDVIEALILLRNPGVRAAEMEFRAALDAYSQVTDLDEVLRTYSAFTESLVNGVGPMKGVASSRTTFPFPGVTSLKGEVVTQSAKTAAEGWAIARWDAVTAGRKLYWNLVFVHQARRIDAETLDLFRQLESVANTRYRAGNTSFQDVIKASIQTHVLGEDLITLGEQRKTLEAALKALVDLPPGSRIGAPGFPSPPFDVPALDGLFAQARENRPELRRMRAMIGKMERMIEMAETMILPPFTLGFSIYDDAAAVQVGPAAMKPAFAETTTAAMGAGLPKQPWFGSNDAWLRQTRLNVAALREKLKNAERATDRMLRDAWFALDKAVRETKLYRKTVVALSRSALDVSTKGYESGGVGFADVIGSYSNWLTVRMALARKQSDIGVARAELMRVAGARLQTD